MNAKQYLEQIEKLEKRARRSAHDVSAYRELAVSIGVDTSKEYVQSSGDSDKIGNAVCKIMDAEREAEANLQRYIERRKIIIGQIEGLENQDYIDILFFRYVEYMTFGDISKLMCYSDRQIYRLHESALMVFDDKYNAFYA